MLVAELETQGVEEIDRDEAGWLCTSFEERTGYTDRVLPVFDI